MSYYVFLRGIRSPGLFITNPERRKDTYYAEPGISREAQAEIKKILWNERMKAEAKRDACCVVLP